MADGNCQAAVPNVLANVTPGDCIGISQSPTAGTLVGVGQTTITVSIAGGPSCTTTFTVNDTTAPQVTCPANITVTPEVGQTSAIVNYSTPLATDACGNANVVCVPASGSTFNAGTTQVTCTATDGSNNTSQCTFNIDVQVPPCSAITCPPPTSAAADGNCQAAVPNVLPNVTPGGCNGISQSPTAGTLVGVGQTTITVSIAGGPSCTTTFTVNDTTAPQVTCPANITVTPQAGQTSATVNYTTPAATDACGTANVVCVPASGSTFNVGTTQVTCTATDGSNNTAQCTFNIEVQEPPCSVTCPANVTVSNDPNQCGAVVNLPAPTTGGTCGAVTLTPPSGSFFQKGTTLVTVTTAAGPSCSFNVTVSDTQAPSITCPESIQTDAAPGATSAIVTFAPPAVGENCPGSSVSCVPASGSTFPVGRTPVTCTATDGSGLTAICGFDVVVRQPIAGIPTLSARSLAALAVLLAALGALVIGRKLS